MAYKTRVFRTMLASPSDTVQIRQRIQKRILEFNYRESERAGYVLQPMLWETHAPPASGDEPQGVIDDVLVSKADILMAIFKDSFGNPAGGHRSGTVHEVETFYDPANGRIPAVIFKKQPAPPKKPTLRKDPKAVRSIAEYRALIRHRNFLTPDYEDDDDFDAVERAMAAIHYQATKLMQQLDALEATQTGLPASGSAAVTHVPEADEEPDVDSSPEPASVNIKSWSDGIRFPMTREMQETSRAANRIASEVINQILDTEQMKRIREASANIILNGPRLNPDIARSVAQTALTASRQSSSDLSLSLRKNDDGLHWSLVNRGETTLTITAIGFSVRTSDTGPLEEIADTGVIDEVLAPGEEFLMAVASGAERFTDTTVAVVNYVIDAGKKVATLSLR